MNEVKEILINLYNNLIMALKSIELKIGNWVEYKGQNYQVIGIPDSKIAKIKTTNQWGGTVTFEVPCSQLNGIRFSKEILSQIEGYRKKDYQEESNIYLISIQEDLKKPNPNNPEENLIIDWSICIKELEGSWWVIIEDSSATFETMGEGEFYFLHDLQNIVSSFIYQEIVWKNSK